MYVIICVYIYVCMYVSVCMYIDFRTKAFARRSDQITRVPISNLQRKANKCWHYAGKSRHDDTTLTA